MQSVGCESKARGTHNTSQQGTRGRMAEVRDVHTLRSRIAARQAGVRVGVLTRELHELQQHGHHGSAVYAMKLSALLRMLRDGLAEESAVEALAELVIAACGEEAALIGSAVREAGALDDLLDLLRNNAQCREAALLVLGNLSSDAVDSFSAKTKAALLQTEGVAATALFECIDTATDDHILALAVGTVQNLCHDPGWAALLHRRGAQETLEALVREHQDTGVVRYAAGALQNMRVALRDADTAISPSDDVSGAVRERSRAAALEEFRYRRAARAIVRAISRMPPEPRLARVMRAQQRPPPPTAASAAAPRERMLRLRHTHISSSAARAVWAAATAPAAASAAVAPAMVAPSSLPTARPTPPPPAPAVLSAPPRPAVAPVATGAPIVPSSPAPAPTSSSDVVPMSDGPGENSEVAAPVRSAVVIHEV